jgi:dihydrofolate reductase
MGNIVYIGTSLDGFIADREGGLEWLESVPNPDNEDFGWSEFLGSIDAVVMGRNTFETILGFNVGWPYPVPGFILSRSLKNLPEGFEDKVAIISGTPEEITENLNSRGYKNLYIDGGSTIQGFLKKDMIDDLIVTRIPILLGGGTPIFSELDEKLMFTHESTKVYLDELVMSHYKRKR